ncbi:MAG TPA: hypothetical protein VHV51_25750 [Polyangiaceae bacterium]|nr:hypothetical protein [Polyangiaceae bacterium]
MELRRGELSANVTRDSFAAAQDLRLLVRAPLCGFSGMYAEI